MKEATYKLFVIWAGRASFAATTILSIMAAWILFGANIYTAMGIFFIPIAIMVGGSINIAEVIFWIRYINLKREFEKLGKILEIDIDLKKLTTLTKCTIEKQQTIVKESMHKAMMITVSSAFLSITASFAVFYTTYEHGKHLNKISEMQLNSVALRDSTVNQYKHLAKERERIAGERRRYTSLYLDKSAEMIAKSDSILLSKSAKLDTLKSNLKDNMAMSIYKSYANLGGSPDFWASAINLFFVVLIECIMLALSAENHRIYLKQQDVLKGKIAVDSLYENMTVQLDREGNLYLDVDNNGHSKTDKKQLRTVVLQKNGINQTKTDSVLYSRETIADNDVTIDDKLKQFVCFIVDNWEQQGTGMKQSLRNIARIVKREKHLDISHSTIDRILKERKV